MNSDSCRSIYFAFAFAFTALPHRSYAMEHPDILIVKPDLENPVVERGDPVPGKMVLQTLPAYKGTEVFYSLYLPADWEPGKKFPVIIEYRGNKSQVRDRGGIGFGISGGKGFIWAVLPFVSKDHQRDMDVWWGDVNATVAYAKEVVPAICRRWGGDPARVMLAGHSRGAIACNFIGLHDDEISKLWCAMVPLSHYDDGHTAWGMTPGERQLAPERLRRLRGIPQFVCGEQTSTLHKGSDAKLRDAVSEKKLSNFIDAKRELQLVPLTEVEGTRAFIAKHHPGGNFTIVDLPSINHTADYFLRDTPARRQLREWMQKVIQQSAR